jgi:tRNA(fMet)-specific endonuclease VapC
VKYLIDSDWVADYLHGRQPAFNLFDRLADEGVAISVITLGEIYEGIYYGTDPTGYEIGFQQLLRSLTIVDVDSAVAQRYAMLRGHLRQRGLLVPQPDILIAATAVEFDLALVTRNIRHFLRMPGLRLYEQAER